MSENQQSSPQYDVVGDIIQVSPRQTLEFITRFREVLAKDRTIREDFKVIEELMADVDKLAQKLMMPVLELSSVVVPAATEKYYYKNRLLVVIQSAELLLREQYTRLTMKLESAIKSGNIKEKEELVKELRKFIILVFEIHQALLIIEQKLLTIISINAPPNARPPLANMLMGGFDIVKK